MSLYGIFNNMARTLSTMFSLQPSICAPHSNVIRIWDVQQFLSVQKRPFTNYAVMILNRPLSQNPDFLANFWNNASVRVTVDGGTKQWDSLVDKLPSGTSKDMLLPDLITGDFDSITKDIFIKYKKKGCEMVHTPDQMFTDFTKALVELNAFCRINKIKCEHIIAIGQSSGRLDQVLGNIQTMFLVKEQKILSPDMKVYLMTDDAVSWLLRPGEHQITVPKETLEHPKAWCSLVPVGQTCQSVTTQGLKWNLKNMRLRFGEIVSTSNAFDTRTGDVYVKCSHTILWSMRIPSVARLKEQGERILSTSLARFGYGPCAGVLHWLTHPYQLDKTSPFEIVNPELSYLLCCAKATIDGADDVL